LCQVVTTFSKGLISLNNLTRQNQFFATGTSGTDFGISSSVATHTFNLPVASATNTGKLSSTDWSTFNGKVPYTGANANVDLGNFNFDANEISGGSIIAKLNGPASSPFILKSGSSGYVIGDDAISLVSSPTTANTLILASNIGVVTKTAQIGLGSLSATRTFTLPDLSGTLALLEGSQTFTGDKLFNGTVDFNNSVDINSGLFIRNNVIGSTLYTSFTITKASSTQTLSYLFSTGFASNLLFNDAANYSYTFPAASGTIALTSNLSAYVPYIGANANVNLGIYQIISSGADFRAQGVNTPIGLVLSSEYNVIGNPKTIYTGYGESTALGGHEFRSVNGSGTGSITSFYLSPSGAATFYYSVTANSFIKSGGTSSQFLKADGSVDSNTYLTTGSASSTYVPYTGANANLDMGTGVYGINAGQFLLLAKNGSDSLGISAYQGFLNLSGSDGVYLQLNATNDLSLFGRTSGSTSGKIITFTRAGGGIFTSSLSGTSATFSSNVAIGGATSAPTAGLKVAGDIISENGIGVSNVEGGVAANYYTTYSGGGTPLGFLYGSGGVIWSNGGTKMSLTSAGALQLVGGLSATTGTFSSNLSSAQAIFTSATNPLIIKGTNASTQWTEYYYNTSTLLGYIGNGSGILTGGLSSDFIFRSETNFVVATGGNNRRLTITSGGNVGIGTDVPNTLGFSGPMLSVCGTGQGQGIEIWRKSNTIPDGEDLGLITFLAGTTPLQVARIVGKAVGTSEDAGALSFQTSASGGGVTERMRISSAGIITTPNQVSFKAYITANTSLTKGVWNTIPYNGEEYDTQANFSTSTYRFTAPVAGKYLFIVNFNAYSLDDTSSLRVALYINSSATKFIYGFANLPTGNTGDTNISGSDILNLAAGNTVEVRVITDGSGTFNMSQDTTYNSFSGHLL